MTNHRVALAGRLVLARITGTSLDDITRAALVGGTIGGVVLFKDNASSLEQLAELVGQIIDSSRHIPIIAVDQEGGAVQRFDHILTPIPSALSLAASKRVESAYESSAVNARQLSILGINCVLAPVLDVLTNPLNTVISTRAYSDDPEVVAKFARASLDAFKAAGIVAVGKHFPGHGATTEDSHTQLAVNSADQETLQKRDLLPFDLLKSELPAILTAHIWLSGLGDDSTPAALSEPITGGLLREKMGFDGIIMTDDLNMKAVSDRFGFTESSFLSLKAGADVLLVCAGADKAAEVSEYLAEQIENGALTEERLLESHARIERHFSQRPKPLKPDSEQFIALKRSIQDDENSMLALSRQGIALQRGHLPKIEQGAWVIIYPRHPRYSLDLLKPLRRIQTESGRSFDLSSAQYDPKPANEECARLAKVVEGKHCIFVTFRALVYPGQMELARRLSDSCREFCAVVSDTPYDAQGLDFASSIISLLDPSDLAFSALADHLCANSVPPGVIPVSVGE